MKKGALIFAHNNREVDYALMSIIAGGLAKKHLQIPVTLVTDLSTKEWMIQSNILEKAESIFEKIIEVERPPIDYNNRRLYDGVSFNKVVPFANFNRCDAWDLTPYDRTLLLDCDYLIMSNHLNEYWDLDEDVLISSAINDIYDQKRLGYHDRYVSDTGVHLYWATTVMFTKNDRSKSFFDMVNFVRDRYQYYGDLFRFNSQQYRNDISFSVAKHLLSGFETDTALSLPPVLTTIDKDILHSVDESGKLTFMVTPKLDNNYCAVAIKGIDMHIMNKKSIVRNADALMRLI